MRVTFATFVPALKGASVPAGMRSLLAVDLCTLFSSIQLSYPALENGSLMTEQLEVDPPAAVLPLVPCSASWGVLHTGLPGRDPGPGLFRHARNDERVGRRAARGQPQ